MTVRHLVDTDWAIHWLRGEEKIRARLEELKATGIGLSIISFAELCEGILYAREPETAEAGLKDFLSGARMIPLDEETCRIFGRERGRLRSARTVIGDFDLLIAATALHHNLTLLTNNRRHFERVRGLRIESL